MMMAWHEVTTREEVGSWPDDLVDRYFNQKFQFPTSWSEGHTKLFWYVHYELDRGLELWVRNRPVTEDELFNFMLVYPWIKPKLKRPRGRPRLAIWNTEDSDGRKVERELQKKRPRSRLLALEDAVRVRAIFKANKPLLRKLRLSATADLADEIAATRWDVTAESVRRLRDTIAMRKKRGGPPRMCEKGPLGWGTW